MTVARILVYWTVAAGATLLIWAVCAADLKRRPR